MGTEQLTSSRPTAVGYLRDISNPTLTVTSTSFQPEPKTRLIDNMRINVHLFPSPQLLQIVYEAEHPSGSSLCRYFLFLYRRPSSAWNACWSLPVFTKLRDVMHIRPTTSRRDGEEFQAVCNSVFFHRSSFYWPFVRWTVSASWLRFRWAVVVLGPTRVPTAAVHAHVRCVKLCISVDVIYDTKRFDLRSAGLISLSNNRHPLKSLASRQEFSSSH